MFYHHFNSVESDKNRLKEINSEIIYLKNYKNSFMEDDFDFLVEIA